MIEKENNAKAELMRIRMEEQAEKEKQRKASLKRQDSLLREEGVKKEQEERRKSEERKRYLTAPISIFSISFICSFPSVIHLSA